MESEVLTLLRAAEERGLPCILIGGNAIILLGYIRTTADLDLMVPESQRSRWLDLLRELGYQFFNGTSVFAQFEPAEKGGMPVDLMFVNSQTWERLLEGAQPLELAGQKVQLPKPEHLIALKLHAAASPERSKPAQDWEDIRQIVRVCKLDPNEASFREMILRYGGRSALEKIEKFGNEN